MKTTKRIISILLSLMLVLGAVAVGGMTASADDDGIVWNDAESRYEISSYAGLKEFASIVNGEHASIAQNSAACAILTADIDASESNPEAAGYDPANAWTPIGKDNTYHRFTGTFDGDGHKITGLTFNDSSVNSAGLFGNVRGVKEGDDFVGGIVKNVGLEDGNITGNHFVGGIVGLNTGLITGCYFKGAVSGYSTIGGITGRSNNGTVENCFNTGEVSGSNSYIGGVVGDNTKSTVRNCFNTGKISGSIFVGGVVGNATSESSSTKSSVINCYNIGEVSGSDSYGGIIGYNYNSIVSNCYTTGNINPAPGASRIGIIAGVCEGINGDTATVENCYYDSDKITGFSVIGEKNGEVETSITGLTTAQMTGANAAVYMKGLFNDDGTSDDWCITASYPRLIFKIENYDQLKAFSARVNNGDTGLCAKLMNDIDASASAEANDWTPIGNYNNQYTGTFDGDGYVVTGLSTPADYNSNYAGLFGYVGSKTEGGVTTKGIVKNVGLEGGKITGGTYVGGVVGRNDGGTITNCYNTGDVIVTVTGSATYLYVCGVAGINYYGGTITNCYNTGDVTVTETGSATYLYTGGVVGIISGSTIINCYNMGDVTIKGTVTYFCAGGVVGSNNGVTITNCYNTGDVTVTGSTKYIYAGGVAGYNGGPVSSCYSTGAVTTAMGSATNNYTGGVAGNNNSEITYCYYDKTICGNIGAVNGADDASNVKGLTTAQMTGANALRNMVFEYGDGEVSPWLTKANGADVSGKYRLFYPHLKGFDYDLTAASEDWPAKVEVTVTWSGEDSYIYNGQAQMPSVTSVIIGDSAVPEGTLVKYSKYTGSEWGDDTSDSPTDPGKYRMTIRDGDKVIETKYFTILDPDTDYSVTYKVKTDDGWEDVSEPVNAGEYKAIVTFTDTGYLKGQPPIEKEFNIDPKAVAVTACGPDGPIMAYNGQEQVHTDSVIWIYDREETGLDDSKLRYTGNTTVKGTDAGRHSVDLSAEYCFCDDSNYDVTFTAEGDFNFDIAQSVLTITADDLETDYGEDLAGLTYKIEPRFGSYYNTDELGITLSTDADKNKAGTYDITVTVPDNPNYLITTQKGTYTVRQIDTVATVTAEDIDYGQKAVVTFTAPADATGKVTFYLDAADTGTTKDIENGQAVCEFERLNIGSHSVECVYTGDGNYKPGEAKTASFEVKSVDCPLTVNYVYANGSEAAETHTEDVEIFTGYSVISPGITGYTPDTATVEGTMGDDDMDGKTVTVTYTPVEYTAVFTDGNGKTVSEIKYTVETKSIDEPAVPEKEGYEGKWEEYRLTAGGITVKPVYTEIPAEEPSGEPASTVPVNGNRSSVLGYKENQTFTADTADLPEGAEVQWFVNGEEAGTGSEYTVVGPKDDYTVQAKVLDKDGNVLSESSEQNIKVKHGFFDKILFFFAWLLKLLLTPIWYLEGIV